MLRAVKLYFFFVPPLLKGEDHSDGIRGLRVAPSAILLLYSGSWLTVNSWNMNTSETLVQWKASSGSKGRSRMSDGIVLSTGILDKASAFAFLDPDLCLIVKSYSDKRSSHLASLGGGVACDFQVKALQSVSKVNFVP